MNSDWCAGFFPNFRGFVGRGNNSHENAFVTEGPGGRRERGLMSQKRDTYSPARIYVSLEPNLFPPTLGHCADSDAGQGILRVCWRLIRSLR